MTTPTPWKILSSSAAFSLLSEGWTLATLEPGEEQTRDFAVEVVFDTPFMTTPVVQLGITSFDIDQRDSARLTIQVSQISEIGFTAVISTWASTRVYAAGFNWFAIGA